MKPPSPLTVLILLVYTAAMTAYIYGFLHRPDADYAREYGTDEAAIQVSVALLHVALGFVVGPRAIIAPILPIVIAFPAGDYPGRWPEGPVWTEVLFNEVIFGIPLVALGVGIKALAGRRKQPGSTPDTPQVT